MSIQPATRPALAVMHLKGQMGTNLAVALQEANPRWGFSRPQQQMHVIQPGTYLAWLELVTANGQGINAFAVANNIFVRQVHLGIAMSQVAYEPAPRFPGFGYQFSFTKLQHEPLSGPLSLMDAAAWLNHTIDGLALSTADFTTLISTAKASSLAAYEKGAPQTADSYSNRPRLPVPLSPGQERVPAPSETTGTTTSGTMPAAINAAANAFVQAVGDSGLVFKELNETLPKAFFAAIATKPFAILTGLSGSGKTALALALGQWLGGNDRDPNYRLISVRPDWTSPEPLLGYEDVLLPSEGGQHAWAVPDALSFMLKAAANPDQLWLLILDEMNLAHVERYFADVLSGIESHEPVLPNLTQDAQGYWRRRSNTPHLSVPRNLLIVGTVNMDETTFQFSPKVLDRAFSFEVRVATEELTRTGRPHRVQPATHDHLRALQDVLLTDDWRPTPSSAKDDTIVNWLTETHRKLMEIGFEFGHRTFYEALRYADVLEAVGLGDSAPTLDWIVMTKLLPRIHGSGSQLSDFLSHLKLQCDSSSESQGMPCTARKIAQMQAALARNHFVSFSG